MRKRILLFGDTGFARLKDVRYIRMFPWESRKQAIVRILRKLDLSDWEDSYDFKVLNIK